MQRSSIALLLLVLFCGLSQGLVLPRPLGVYNVTNTSSIGSLSFSQDVLDTSKSQAISTLVTLSGIISKHPEAKAANSTAVQIMGHSNMQPYRNTSISSTLYHSFMEHIPISLKAISPRGSRHHKCDLTDSEKLEKAVDDCAARNHISKEKKQDFIKSVLKDPGLITRFGPAVCRITLKEAHAIREKVEGGVTFGPGFSIQLKNTNVTESVTYHVMDHVGCQGAADGPL